MFDKLKQAAALADLMKNKDKLKDAGERVREKMERTQVIGEGGAGVETFLHAEDAQELRFASGRLDRFGGESLGFGRGIGVKADRRCGQEGEKEESDFHGLA